MEVQTADAAPAAPEGNVASAASTPEVANTTTNDKPTIQDTMAAVFDKMNPQERVNRSETGKFESKAAPETAAPDEVSTQGQTPTAPSEPAKPAITAPQSLPAELRDKWASVPPELAEWTAKREAEAHKRITELGETAKASEQIRSVVDRYRETFRGVPVDQGLEKLLAANAFLDKSPVDGIKWLADAYGVDLSAFAAKPGEEVQESGEVRALKAELNSLKREIADTRNRVQTREQREESERSQSLAKLVEDFAKDKADHWADVEADVLEQLLALRETKPDLAPDQRLKLAYDRSLKINETVSKRLADEKRKKDEAEAEAKRKKAADEAKRQASLNVKSTNGASPSKAKSMEQTMREVADRLMPG